MIGKIANKWALWLTANSGQKDDYDIFVYAIESLINQVLINAVLIIIGFIIGLPLQMITYQIFFMLLRVNIGGVHGISHLMCIIISIAIPTACCFLVQLIVNYPVVLAIELIFCIFITFRIAPVTHPNKPVSDLRKNKFRVISRWIVVIEAAVVILFYYMLPLWAAHIAALGMTSASVGCLIGKIINPRIKAS